MQYAINRQLKASKFGNHIVDYLKINQDALEQIKKLLSEENNIYPGIKISVRTRGCSGLSYTVNFAEPEKNITKYDEVVEIDDVAIFIDPKASMFLIGSEMIYQDNGLESGFDFINPNEKGRCGCGESFKV